MLVHLVGAAHFTATKTSVVINLIVSATVINLSLTDSYQLERPQVTLPPPATPAGSERRGDGSTWRFSWRHVHRVVVAVSDYEVNMSTEVLLGHGVG